MADALPGFRKIRIALFAVAVLGISPPMPVWAHGGGDLTALTALVGWQLTPEMVIITVLLVSVYLRGMSRRRDAAGETPRWRHVMFFAGVAAIFLSLQSPIDPLAERLFWMHQAQHLLLRMLGPMLIALSAPQATLVAGLPRSVRGRVLAPLASAGPFRTSARFLARPEIAFALFVAALYIWQIPSLHNIALLSFPIHYFMHVTMLAAGLLFWFVIFDRRDPPKSIPHPARLMMLIGVILSNILLGAVTTLKETVIYTAYDFQGRLFGIDPLTDEIAGGLIIWIPSSMMCAIAVLIAMHRWAAHEHKGAIRRLEWSPSNSRALEWPETAEELRIKVAASNRITALVLSAVSLSIFVIALATAIMIHNSA